MVFNEARGTSYHWSDSFDIIWEFQVKTREKISSFPRVQTVPKQARLTQSFSRSVTDWLNRGANGSQSRLVSALTL